MAGGFPVGYPIYGRLPVGPAVPEPEGRIGVPEKSLPPWERMEPLPVYPPAPPAPPSLPVYGRPVLPPVYRRPGIVFPFWRLVFSPPEQEVPQPRKPRNEGVVPPDILERGPSVGWR